MGVSRARRAGAIDPNPHRTLIPPLTLTPAPILLLALNPNPNVPGMIVVLVLWRRLLLSNGWI